MGQTSEEQAGVNWPDTSGMGGGSVTAFMQLRLVWLIHQSSSRKVRTTIFYKIGVRESLWSKDLQSPMVHFLPNLAKSTVHTKNSLQFLGTLLWRETGLDDLPSYSSPTV